MQLILISGLSGSGKSIVLAVLEDCGYYCVDNLPVQLLPDTIHHLRDAGCGSVAVSVDVRSGAGLQQLPEHARVLKEEGIDVRVLFLEANTETLVKRFSETRRRHPLSDANKTLPEAIQLEREMLEGIGWLGHNIDTTELSPNTLRAWVKDFIALDRSRLTLLFESFGFKHGIPLDADFMFDVRCLPNPHYDPRLRPLTGRDEPVITFMEANADAQKMLADIGRYVEDWLPCFIRDNRNYLTVALGCTGGQHRSVYFVEKLAARFRGQIQVLVRHRELA